MSYIKDGKFYKGNLKTQHLESSTYKGWSHQSQRDNHRKDMIQPYKEGRPNPEFVSEYREQSKEYGFIPKEES